MKRAILMTLMVLASSSLALAAEPTVKKTTVVLKYADGSAIERMLRPYLTHSGEVRYEADLRTLTIVDEPATVDAILKIVAQFDIRQPQLQFTLKLVVAEKSDKPQPLPPELAPIAKQLSEVFSYNSFTILDTAFINTFAGRDAELSVAGSREFTAKLRAGILEADTVRLEFRLYRKERIADPQKGTLFVNDNLVATTVELKDGETIILGASKIDGDNKALVTVLTLKVKK